jgi:hypothetical protein
MWDIPHDKWTDLFRRSMLKKRWKEGRREGEKEGKGERDGRRKERKTRGRKGKKDEWRKRRREGKRKGLLLNVKSLKKQIKQTQSLTSD